MKRPFKAVRKLIVLVVGLPLFVLGLALIPLPGPGVLVSLIALSILSLEFEQAEAPLMKAKATLKAIYNKSKARADKISK